MLQNRDLLQVPAEELVARLSALSKRQPLKGADLEISESIMKELRRRGWKNEEIHDATDGAYSVNTIKEKARGAKVEDIGERQKFGKVFAEMQARGITFEDVEKSKTIQAALQSDNLTIEDVMHVTQVIRNSNIELHELSEGLGKLRDVPPEKINDLAHFNEQLNAEGLAASDLQPILKHTGEFGSIAKLMEAVSKYNEDESVRIELDQKKKEANELDDKIRSGKEELSIIECKRAEAQTVIDRRDELASKGFNDEVLSSIIKIAIQNGGSVEQTMAILSTPEEVQKLLAKEKELKISISEQEAKKKQLEAGYAHYWYSIKLCNLLIYKYHFTSQAIRDVWAAAAQYGDPHTVLSAIEKFQKVAELDKEIQQKQLYISELEKKTNEVEVKYKLAIKLTMNRIVTLSPAIEEQIKKSMAGANELACALIKKIDDKNDEYVETLSKATQVQDDLKLARVIKAAFLYPSDIAKVDVQYGRIILEGAYKFFEATGINPLIKPSAELVEKYPFMDSRPYGYVNALDILQWITDEYSDEVAASMRGENQ